jgi:hypothetical protein
MKRLMEISRKRVTSFSADGHNKTIYDFPAYLPAPQSLPLSTGCCPTIAHFLIIYCSKGILLSPLGGFFLFFVLFTAILLP